MTRFIDPETFPTDDAFNDDVVAKLNTPIQQFYGKTNIFITGGTGFMGKVLTEKLLRSCPDVEHIYLLMRPKKGQQVEERMDKIFDDALFLRLLRAQPKFRHKLTAVTGDCALPGLGLTIADRAALVERVDVVFHGAATVRFDESLRMAVGINVNGTRDMLALAREMKRLKGFVHVSTAYCNCHLPAIDERFYAPPMPHRNLTDLVDACDDALLKAITPQVLDKWPNTYALTKAVAEDIIRHEGGGLPIVVFRPAIVVGIRSEPLPGWIDNLYGPTGVLVGAGTGVLKTLHADPEAEANIVPVDMAVNAIIAAAWDVATTDRNGDTPIYNYVSSCEQPLRWNDFVSLTERYGMAVPVKRAIWYYSFTVNKHYWIHWLYVMFLHFLPAFFIDAVASCRGKTPKLVKIYQKIDKFSKVISYFSTKTWRFSNNNVRALWTRLSPDDQEVFMFDMRRLDWHDFFYNYVRGCRVFIAKDSMASVPAALLRWRRLYWLHQGVKTLCLLVFLRVAWFVASTVSSLVNASE